MPRRGYKFESQINKVCKYVEAIGGHAHKNYPKRLQDGTYIEGEPFDYEVFLPNYKAVFDAKECKNRKWRMVEKDIKQTNELKKCKNAGLKAYFLICFENKDVRMVDVDKVIKILKSGSKTISAEGNSSWDLIEYLEADDNRGAGVRKRELNRIRSLIENEESKRELKKLKEIKTELKMCNRFIKEKGLGAEFLSFKKKEEN